MSAITSLVVAAVVALIVWLVLDAAGADTLGLIAGLLILLVGFLSAVGGLGSITRR